MQRIKLSTISSAIFLIFSVTIGDLPAQNTQANVIVVSDTAPRPASSGVASPSSDRITLLDGSAIVGKIIEMNPSRVVIKTAGSEYVVDPAKIEKVERNIIVDPYADKQRFVEVRTKDHSRIRGTIKRADATTTYVQNSLGEIPIRNTDVENIEYLDSDKAKQADRVAARPPVWELTLKGGSMFYQLGTYNNLLSPGYFGLIQIQYPHFTLPLGLRIAPGLQTGYIQNSGKALASTNVDLFPGFLTVAVSYQIADTRFDVFAQGLFGVNLTRVISSNPAEKLSLDLAYGAELGGKYHISSTLNVSLAGIWMAVSESSATLNHIGAYASVGFMF